MLEIACARVRANERTYVRLRARVCVFWLNVRMNAIGCALQLATCCDWLRVAVCLMYPPVGGPSMAAAIFKGSSQGLSQHSNPVVCGSIPCSDVLTLTWPRGNIHTAGQKRAAHPSRSTMRGPRLGEQSRLCRRRLGVQCSVN